ncbi:MAG TPA: NAD(P)-binding domain-containing protein, partial [Phototrophicaceae bacterium]|nr:NAD(P)-binding domain-containing protein [Phototrophicaceae bacterium]
MKITILGTGKIGGTLGRKWVTAGHEVQFSVRNMNKPEAVTLVQSLGERASLADVSSAIRFGEVVVFAIPGSAM